MKNRNAALALSFLGLFQLGSAQTKGSNPLVDVRTEVATALYAASATAAASDRALDDKFRAMRKKIDLLELEKKSDRTELAELKESYVSELAQRDKVYSQEIAVFRNAVQDISTTREGAEALARFNANDEIGALSIWDRLADARERGRKVRLNIETAADRRRVAQLAFQARNRGRIEAKAVISRFEEVVRLDPSMQNDWLTLARLYRFAGSLAQAQDAAERAIKIDSSTTDRAAAIDELGDVLNLQGDSDGALTQFKKSLEIRNKLIRDSATTESEDFDLEICVSNSKIGMMLEKKGDLKGALSNLEICEKIYMKRAAEEKLPKGQYRNLAVFLNKIADILYKEKNIKDALVRYETSLKIRQIFASDFPDSQFISNDLAHGFLRVGQIQCVHGDFAQGLANLEESLRIYTKLLNQDPDSAEFASSISLVLLSIGEAHLTKEDLSNANRRFEEALQFQSQLAAKDPKSISASRYVAYISKKIGSIDLRKRDLKGAQKKFAEALKIYKLLRAKVSDNYLINDDYIDLLEEQANLNYQLNDLVGSLSYHEEILSLRQKHLKQNPSDAEVQNKIGLLFNVIGGIQTELNNLSIAKSKLTEALAIQQRLMLNPDPSLFVSWNFGFSHYNLGMLMLKLGDLNAGQAYLEKSLEIWQSLVDKNPKHAKLQGSLADAIEGLGDVFLAKGDVENAKKKFEESFEIYRRLDLQSAILRSLDRLAKVPASNVTWTQVLLKAEKMKAEGILELRDAANLEDWRLKSTSEKKM